MRIKKMRLLGEKELCEVIEKGIKKGLKRAQRALRKASRRPVADAVAPIAMSRGRVENTDNLERIATDVISGRARDLDKIKLRLRQIRRTPDELKARIRLLGGVNSHHRVPQISARSSWPPSAA
jgi:hypothetical protein